MIQLLGIITLGFIIYAIGYSIFLAIQSVYDHIIYIFKCKKRLEYIYIKYPEEYKKMI